MSRIKIYSIIAIVFLAAIFRLYGLGSVPPSPSLDEVSIGYNAYSILHTGRDEYKQLLPLQMRAYDDFRPALYLYPVVASVFMFGLNSFAVRLPSVLLSLLTLYFIYKAVELLSKRCMKSDVPAVWALAIAAVSPWHIYISRLGHEANLGIALFTGGVYGLLHWVELKRSTSLYWAATLLGLSLYGYQSEKVVLPVFGLIFVLLFWKRLVGVLPTSIKAGLLFIAVSIYAVILTVGPQGLSRLHGTGAVSADNPKVVQARKIHAEAVGKGDKVGAILSSKYVTAFTIVSENYFSHFMPQWLFFGQQRESHKVPYLGLLQVWVGVLICVGVWSMWKKMPKELIGLILAWILTGPIPAAITTQAPHAMRAFTMFPPLVMIAGFGAYAFIRSQKWAQICSGVFVCLLIYSSGILCWRYFITFPTEQSDSFQYAMADGVAYLLANEKDYERVVFANNGAGYQSYMFFLFYSQFNPKTYHSLGGTKSGGYAESHVIGKYTFMPLFETEVMQQGTLYIADVHNVPKGAIVQKEFINKDGTPALVAVSL